MHDEFISAVIEEDIRRVPDDALTAAARAMRATRWWSRVPQRSDGLCGRIVLRSRAFSSNTTSGEFTCR